MNKSMKKSKNNKVKRSIKKRFTKKKSIKKNLQKKYTKKNKRKIGGEGKETKLAILLITTHGNLDNLKPLTKHEEDINVYKINATKPGVCNYIQDDELRDMGTKISDFINTKKKGWEKKEMLKDSNNILFKNEKQRKKELDDLTKELSELLPKIDEVHKEAKKISKSLPGKKKQEDSDFFDSDNSDEDLKQYKQNINETYKISKWEKNDEYNDKAYTIILDERTETNCNPYNNTIILLGEPGMPELEDVKMTYNLRNIKEKTKEEEQAKEEVEEKEEKDKEKEEVEEKEEKEEKDKKKEDVFDMREILNELKKIKEGNESEESEESEESDEEYDTNKYISLSEVLKNLKEKGYTDTVIIDLSCSVGYDDKSSRILRRKNCDDKYGGN